MSRIPLVNSSLPPAAFQQPNTPIPARRSLDAAAFQRDLPIDFSEKQPSFRLFAEDTRRNSWAPEMLRGGNDPTPISWAFFSRSNIDYLQKALISAVYRNSGHKIGPQDETTLVAIMGNTYKMYSHNSPTNDPREIRQALRRLNLYVLQEIVPDVISEVEMYLTYLRDASQNPVPNSRPIDTSVTGTKDTRDYADVVIGKSMY